MSRIAQGWGTLGPKEARPYAQLWMKELDRHGVSDELYETLVDMAIDKRARAISADQPPPPFTVELLLAVFARYKEDKHAEHRALKEKLERLDNAKHLLTGGSSVRSVLNYLSRDFRIEHEPEGATEFYKFIREAKAKITAKLDAFYRDAHLNEPAQR